MANILQFIGVGTILIHKNDLKYINSTCKHSDYGFDKPYVVTKSYKRGTKGPYFEIMGIYSDGVHSRSSGLTREQIKKHYEIYPRELSDLHKKLKRKAMDYKPITMQETKEILSDLFKKARKIAKDLNKDNDIEHINNMSINPELYCISCGNYLPDYGIKDSIYCNPCQVDNAKNYIDEY